MTNRSSDKLVNKTIVRAFLEAAGIPIHKDAIQDADEPLPDVLCTFANGTQTAFELTEAVDEGVAENVKVSPASRAEMREYYENLSVADQLGLQEILRNAYISVQTKRGATFKQIVPKVFNLLRVCSCDTEGSIEKSALPTGVKDIRITRGKWSTGPFFDRGGLALCVSDPTIKQIETKFGKKYQCDCPIELLVHSRTCPLAPDDLWRNDVHDFVVRNIGVSPFRRVSVFDWIDSTIRYTYPER